MDEKTYRKKHFSACCEPLLQEMIQKDTEKYLGRKVPVFYHRKKTDRVITYLEDSISPETEGEK